MSWIRVLPEAAHFSMKITVLDELHLYCFESLKYFMHLLHTLLLQMGVALFSQFLHGEPVVKIHCMAPSGDHGGPSKNNVS